MSFLVLAQFTLGEASVDSLYMRVRGAWPFFFATSVATDGKQAFAGAREGVYVTKIRQEKPKLVKTAARVMRVKYDGGLVYAVLAGTEGIQVFDRAGNPVNSYVSSANCMDIDFSGNYGYIAAGGEGLTVVRKEDLEDVAYVALPGFAQAVDVSGNYAVVAMGDKGIVLLDVSNPSSPKQLAAYSDIPAMDAVIVGKYILVAAGREGLVALDLSQENPIVGKLQLPGSALRVKVQGKYAYVACGKGGVRVVDISNLARMVVRAYYDTAGTTLDVDVAFPYVYVADGQYGVVIMENLLRYKR